MQWQFWKRRNTSDPLAREFLDKYYLHLLTLPREDVYVGDLYAYDGKRVFGSGSIVNFLEPSFNIPHVNVGEIMAGVAGQFSNSIEANIGLDFLENFVSALGGTIKDIHGIYESSGTQFIKFRFPNLTRDWIDIMDLASNINNYSIKKEHGLYAKEYQYFLVTAVVRTNSISITAEKENDKIIDQDVNILRTADISARLTIFSSGKNEITYSSKRKLAVAVEVHEINYNSNTNKFRILLLEEAIRFRGQIKPSFIGDPELASAFIDVG